jgi:uncharacterized SAM-dependent methyltransferase
VVLHKNNDSEREKFLKILLETGQAHPRSLYETPAQSTKWSELHHKYSPLIHDPETISFYQESFQSVLNPITAERVQVVSIGCGTGSKDVHLLNQLHQRVRSLRYVPSDVSESLVVQASSQMKTHQGECLPVVGDFEASDFADKLPAPLPDEQRIVLFFGILPNIRYQQARSSLSKLLRKEDVLIVGTNLVPHRIEDILPQYDNPETCEWLTLLLKQFEFDITAGEFQFSIGQDPDMNALKRIEARYGFKKSVTIQFQGKSYTIGADTSWLIFFSNRYSLPLLKGFVEDLKCRSLFEGANGRRDEGIVSGIK